MGESSYLGQWGLVPHFLFAGSLVMVGLHRHVICKDHVAARGVGL